MPLFFKFRPGQVVYCKFPREEDPSLLEDRPCLILSALEKSGAKYYRVAKMTKTNNSHRFIGIWVLMNSRSGRSMSLDYDTFIHLERIEVVPEFGIRRLKSICSIFEDVVQKCKENDITI